MQAEYKLKKFLTSEKLCHLNFYEFKVIVVLLIVVENFLAINVK